MNESQYDSSAVGEEPRRPRFVQKLTNGDRRWICQRRKDYPNERFVDMRLAFRSERNPDVELKSGTVAGIVKSADKWLSIHDDQESGTRTRTSKEPELEAALFAWREDLAARREKVRDEDLRVKAYELALLIGINTTRSDRALNFSSGWLDRFKKRCGIRQNSYKAREPKRRREAQLRWQPSVAQQYATSAPLPRPVMQDPAAVPLPDCAASGQAPGNAGVQDGLHLPLPHDDILYAASAAAEQLYDGQNPATSQHEASEALPAQGLSSRTVAAPEPHTASPAQLALRQVAAALHFPVHGEAAPSVPVSRPLPVPGAPADMAHARHHELVTGMPVGSMPPEMQQAKLTIPNASAEPLPAVPLPPAASAPGAELLSQAAPEPTDGVPASAHGIG